MTNDATIYTVNNINFIRVSTGDFTFIGVMSATIKNFITKIEMYRLDKGIETFIGYAEGRHLSSLRDSLSRAALILEDRAFLARFAR